MYFIGLDVHKKTTSYCVKDATGRVHQEGKIGSTRRELDGWIRTMPQPRDMISRSQKLDYALVSSLHRDPVLKERLRRLRTVPGVGPITALTWALEIGDYTRFPSIKQAISYCGLCGDEKSQSQFCQREVTPFARAGMVVLAISELFEKRVMSPDRFS